MSEARDSLRSTSYARLLDVISEGPIGGLVDGARSIFLNDTRLQNADGSFNFSGFKWVERKGQATQDPIAGFNAVESVTSVSVQVKHGIPVVRTITNSALDAVLVTLAVPSLSFTDKDSGDIKASVVNLQVEVRANGGAWTAVGTSDNTGAMTNGEPENAVMPAGTTAIRLDVQVKVEAPAFGSYPYRVDYRLVGAGSWSELFSSTLRAEPYTQPPIADELPTTGYSGSESRATTVPAGRYEVRVVNIGPAADFALSANFVESLPIISIRGKTSSRYQRQVRVKLPAGGAPWDIRVTRITGDSNSAYISNDLFWDSYTEVTEAKLSYPYSAMVALSVDASQFSQIPSRAYDVRLLLVKVPTNYDPLARTYSGSWDGTFKTAWTDNPAWCFYDLATNPRYGLGAFLGSGVDKWALYEIGRYCDELVPNGLGGMEPRFSCNVLLGSKQEAFKVLSDLATVFRGMVYWGAGSLVTVQDAPSDPVALFSPANVIGGVFNYSGSSSKVRHTAALVTWNDPADMCRQKVEYVEDRDGIARYGLVMTEVVAVGCTSRGQANRVGRWLLYSERAQTDTVTFKVGLDGAIGRPGQVIKIADPLRAGVRYGGRLLAATATSLTVDAPLALDAGTYTVTVFRQDGKTLQDGTVTLSAAAPALSVLTVAGLVEAPATGGMWVMTSTAVQPQLYRVVGVREVERHLFEVTAVEHDPDKWAAVELGLKIQPRSYSVLGQKPAAPTNVVAKEVLVRSGAVVSTRFDLSWTPAPGAASVAVSWVRSDGTEAPEVIAYTSSIEVPAVIGSTYTFSLWSINGLGVRSAAPATLTQTAMGLGDPPPDVTGLLVARNGQEATLRWDPIESPFLAGYEVRRGESWATAAVLDTTATASLSFLSPRGGTYLVRAVDVLGQYSLHDAAAVLPDLSSINVVVSSDQGSQDWPGTRANLASYSYGWPVAWDELGSWVDLQSWDELGRITGLVGTGAGPAVYTTQPLDLGAPGSGVVTVNSLVVAAPAAGTDWTDYDAAWTTYAGGAWTWLGDDSAITALLEVSTSDDGVAWSDWAAPAGGAVSFRYLRARLTMTSSDPRFVPFLRGMTVNVDVPDRLLHLGDVAVPAGGVTVPFSPAFIGVQTVQVTLQSAAASDSYTVTGKSPTGVTVAVFDSTGAPKAGLVDIDVYGYGERY